MCAKEPITTSTTVDLISIVVPQTLELAMLPTLPLAPTDSAQSPAPVFTTLSTVFVSLKPLPHLARRSEPRNRSHCVPLARQPVRSQVLQALAHSPSLTTRRPPSDMPLVDMNVWIHHRLSNLVVDVLQQARALTARGSSTHLVSDAQQDNVSSCPVRRDTRSLPVAPNVLRSTSVLHEGTRA